jgi:hypothetical protein
MRAYIIFAVVLMLAAVAVAALPEVVLIAWRSDLSSVKVQAAKTACLNRGVDLTSAVYTNSTWTGTWNVACTYGVHFTSKPTKSWIDTVSNAVSDNVRVKLFLGDLDDVAATLQKWGLSRK